MKQYIKITRCRQEEPQHLNLIIEASSGTSKGQLEYYCNATDLKDISYGISQFLDENLDEYKYEIGSEDPEKRFAH